MMNQHEHAEDQQEGDHASDAYRQCQHGGHHQCTHDF